MFVQFITSEIIVACARNSFKRMQKGNNYPLNSFLCLQRIKCISNISVFCPMTDNESKCDGCTLCFQLLQLAGEVSFVLNVLSETKRIVSLTVLRNNS